MPRRLDPAKGLPGLFARGRAKGEELSFLVQAPPAPKARRAPRTRAVVAAPAPDPELEAGLWLLTHPDLRHTARVRAFMDFAGAEIAKRRIKLEGGERATRDVA